MEARTTKPDENGMPRTRHARGTKEIEHKIELQASSDVVDQIAINVADRMRAHGGGGGGGGGKGAQVTLSIGVITACLAFLGLIGTLAATVWTLSAEIERKVNRREVVALESSLSRIEQTLVDQDRRIDVFWAREFPDLMDTLKRVQSLAQDHETRLRVMENFSNRMRPK